MPRKPREKSATGIYHIMMRGINRQNIFEDEEDHLKFMQTLEKYKDKSGYYIYAYCLMGNHVHILLMVGVEPLEQVMRRICGSYVYWYNKKYQRIGNLFQDRFKSEVVENDNYFLTVLRYIHQNPLKAGLVKDIEQYQWSSIGEYASHIDSTNIVDTNFALKLFADDEKIAVRELIKFFKEVNDDKCLEIDDRIPITDEEAKAIVKKVCQLKSPSDLQMLEKKQRNKYLKMLKEEHNLSIRQIERITGINRGVIAKA